MILYSPEKKYNMPSTKNTMKHILQTSFGRYICDVGLIDGLNAQMFTVHLEKTTADLPTHERAPDRLQFFISASKDGQYRIVHNKKVPMNKHLQEIETVLGEMLKASYG